ncbi:glucose-6-Phosphatase isoform X2 [Arctopsyche grandis]|uniref:glucose-6-Phosphatase isoform X2 n=1 Tax=Arctopsyche grandis TaxID=121162 RepID=UPI00406D98F4
MMDNVYAFGAECIVFIQTEFAGYDDVFTKINNLADPRYTLTHFLPIISMFDSYFASEFILVTSIGGWLNSMLKWMLIEHRPYWWVRETHFYGPIRSNKPLLRLGPQTCETGPGSPSGHVMFAAIVLALISSWISIILSQKQILSVFMQKIIKNVLWVIIGVILILVTISRLFIATHFPHQCLIGAIFGFLTVYFISTFWMEPFMGIDNNKLVKENPNLYRKHLKLNILFNLSNVVFLVASPFALYWGQKLYGFDPLWSVKLAFKWCPAPEFVHYDTTPLYSFVKATGSVLGWVLCSTPSIKSYRYDSKNRSMVLAALCALVFQQVFAQWQESISREDAVYFYLANFFANAVRPLFFIRMLPLLTTVGQKIKSKNRKGPMNDEASNKNN